MLNAYFAVVNELATKTESFPDRIVHALTPVLVDKLADGKV